jgi:hypothetical protein
MSPAQIQDSCSKDEKLSAGGSPPVILVTWETEIGMIKVQGQPGQTVLETKMIRAKRTGSVAQVVGLCKYKTLSLNPWVHKKKKKKVKTPVHKEEQGDR